MFRLFTTIFLVISLSWNMAAQCPEGDVELTSQAEVDAFVAEYPDCTELGGNLIIGDFETVSDVSDLSGLSNINSVGGDLRIQGNPDLSTLNGLDNLNTVGGNFVLQVNNALSELTPLSNLTTIGGDLEISGNSGLVNLTGLESLNTLVGGLKITSMNSLVDLTGLNNLNTIGGELNVQLNNSLVNFNGLNNLTNIGGRILLSDNSALENFSGLNNLTQVEGDIGIIFSDVLTSLSGLNSLTSVNELTMSDNPLLADLTALSNLTTVEVSLQLFRNASLTNLDGLQNVDIAGMTSNLFIANNEALSNCAIENLCAYLAGGGFASIFDNAPGCDSREEVEAACVPDIDCPEGDFVFSSQAEVDAFVAANPNCSTLSGSLRIGNGQNDTDINDLSGLSNLTNIGGDLIIFFNSNLNSLQGLDNVSSIGGGLLLFRNDNLTDLNGLGSLTTIGGAFYSFRNGRLLSFTGLDALTSVGGNFIVRDNDALGNLSGLESLTAIGGFLAIRDNDALTDLAGIDNVAGSTIQRLYITGNPMLTNCAIESICAYLGISESIALIAKNGSKCNTRPQVENACGPSSGSMAALDLPAIQGEENFDQHTPLAARLQLYPNPTNGLLQIRQADGLQSVVVHSPQGQQIAHYDRPATELDLSNLPAGVYYLSFLTATERVTRRVVKIE